MATNLPEVRTYIEGDKEDPSSVGILTWLINTATASTDANKVRGWCTLNLPGIKSKDLFKYFDRSKIGEEYLSEFNKESKAGSPFAFLQRDSDIIYSMHRCFNLRYKGRLMNYRDDCSQKRYHTLSSLSLALGKYITMKTAAHKNASRPLNDSLTLNT